MIKPIKRTAKAMENAIHRSLEQRLGSFGYAIWSGHRTLVKQVNFGHAQIFVPTRKAPKDRFATFVHLGIRIHLVEELRNRNNLRLDDKFKLETITVGMEMSHLWDFGMPHPWLLNGPEDIPEVADDMLEKIFKYAFPYFQKYSSLEAILQSLMDDSRYGWMNGGGPDFQFHKAITLALLMRKEDALIQNIIEIAHGALERTHKDIAAFDAYVNSLRALDLPILTDPT
jgi:hypothetical protein